MSKMTIACIAAAALALGGCVSQQKYDESEQRNAELEKEYQELNQAMGAEVGAKDMQISRMQDAIKVSINSELLFASGGWDMTDKAKESVGKIVSVLAPHQTTTIHVNGYTDTTPIGPGLAKQGVTTNVILSQKRADTVMQFMLSKGANPKLISAHGFGEANPVASNDTASGKAQNRRVELTVAPAK
jgi:chemotaxis protein MotB